MLESHKTSFSNRQPKHNTSNVMQDAAVRMMIILLNLKSSKSLYYMTEQPHIFLSFFRNQKLIKFAEINFTGISIGRQSN